MSGVRELDRLLDLILEAAGRLAAADRCSCFVVDDRTGELLTRVAQGSATIRLPKGSGLAGSVAESGVPVNIADCYADPRFNSEHDRRSGYRTRSMLCLPLINREGSVVGVLQALNKMDRGGGGKRPPGPPRSSGPKPEPAFDAYDERVLGALCSHAAVAIETARLVARDLERQRLQRDMELAQDIQRRMQPDQLPELSGWRLAAWQRSCEETGGDYFDMVPVGDRELDLVVGDVSGHGLGAALFMSTARAFLRALHGQPTAMLLARMNELLEADMPDDSFMTLLLTRIGADGALEWWSAGHHPPLVWRAGRGACEPLEGGGLLLGAIPGAEYEGYRLAPMARGDCLVLITDGPLEARSVSGEEWGQERLRGVVAQHASRGAQAVLEAIIAAAKAWGGETLLDDWTVIVAERRA